LPVSLASTTLLCNRFRLKDGVLTGEVDEPILWGPGKAVAVQALCADRGVDLSSSYFYADGDEDPSDCCLWPQFIRWSSWCARSQRCR